MTDNSKKTLVWFIWIIIIVIFIAIKLFSCGDSNSSSSSNSGTASCQSCGATYREGTSNYKKIRLSNLCIKCYNHMKSEYEKPIK